MRKGIFPERPSLISCWY
ncbi:unnamed protein product [Timema podura]|uniref:Uncharacterized protein n=1 Tax=Timema podura TaxID=61482 RepID=A0ABN7PN05_TIMPD|nr:unnamed protein product [Timema podura]